MKIIGLITVVIITLILSAIWRGYVLTKLWIWFIVSTFGASPLRIAEAIGVALVVSFLCYQYNSYEDKDASASERLIKGISVALLSPAVVLLVGWIVKSWI